jgi:hypothetical protein
VQPPRQFQGLTCESPANGDLPFRYVGKHRRTKLKHVLALKTRIDDQRTAMEALAEDAEDLRQRYGV